MDQIKAVIDELNQPPFSKNLNLIGYDSLRSEQRLDILIQILNTIDPKLNLPTIRVGNVEEIVTTILDQLRIYKYPPPADQINPVEFRKNLILADKDLLTNIFQWLLSRLGPLKKRAYLARFLVKIELSPDVEGDHDVLLIYKQYLRLIDEFKKAHSGYESQKKSLDSIIELQKDIKSMEIEKEQIQNKLEMVRRRVNFESAGSGESNDSGTGIGGGPIQSSRFGSPELFDSVKRFVQIRNENDKLQRQLREQAERIERCRVEIDSQQRQLTELRNTNRELCGDQSTGTKKSADSVLNQMEDDVGIRERLAKVVLPGELDEIRSMVRDLENIYDGGQSDTVIKDFLTKINNQIQLVGDEIALQMEKKILGKSGPGGGGGDEDDRLSHYRTNAQAVSEKKQTILQQLDQMESSIAEKQLELDQLRTRFNEEHGSGGTEAPLHGDALKLYIEKISKRDTEQKERSTELANIERELGLLERKLTELKHQEKSMITEIDQLEENVGIDGYFRMKENTLSVTVVDEELEENGDGIEDHDSDTETINRAVLSLEQRIDSIQTKLAPLTREVKQLKQIQHELENEYDMKKRMYDSAAAGLEAELSRSESEFTELNKTKLDLGGQQFLLETELLVLREEWKFLKESESGGQTVTLQTKLAQEIEHELAEQVELKQREQRQQTNEEYYRKQIGMWRDLKALLEVKADMLALKEEQKARDQMMVDSNYNHFVLQN